MDAKLRLFPWWIPLGAIACALLYLPTLNTPFDFIDDGNLVYPTQPMPFGQRVGVVWEKIQANVDALGPFRPVLWAHWELQADLFDGNPLAWRTARLCWCAFAAGMLLWLLKELRANPVAALLAGALAMWTPFRNEIWTSLTLAEGVAMPYALFGLVAAIRAARAETRVGKLIWDVAAVAGVLMALGCKNVFVALLPAQILLRLCPDRWELLTALRSRGWRIIPYAIPMIPFVAHLVYFNSHWHAGQYRPPGPSWTQFFRYLKGLQGAISFDFVGVALLVCAVGIVARRAIRELWRDYSAAVTASCLLTASGIVIYLPMDAVSGRYTVPAVWGLDILIAVLLSRAVSLPSLAWRRAAIGAMAIGLCCVAASNIGKQQRFAARAKLFWQTIQFVEKQPLTPNDAVAWISDPDTNSGGQSGNSTPIAVLNVEEGVHFDWHIHARQRIACVVELLDESGRAVDRPDIKTCGDRVPALIITASAPPPSELGLGWQKVMTFEEQYWAGAKKYQCTLWSRADKAVAQSK